MRDCFSAAAIQSSDGAFLLGVMGSHTFNAGKAYFPCGTPDPNDIIGGKVDLELSVRRELKEETGLAMDDFTPEPGWTMIVDGALIGQIKVLRARESAKALHDRIIAFLARTRAISIPELRRITFLALVRRRLAPAVMFDAGPLHPRSVRNRSLFNRTYPHPCQAFSSPLRARTVSRLGESAGQHV